MKTLSFILTILVLLLSIQSANEDSASLALNYLFQRFGSSNYEIIKSDHLGVIDVIGVTDNRKYYTFQIETLRNSIIDFKAKELNLDFSIQQNNSALEIECLGLKEEGFSLIFYKPFTVSIEYYNEKHIKEENLSYSINDLSLIEFKDLNSNGLPDEEEIIHEVNLRETNPIRRENIIFSSLGKAVEAQVSYIFSLNNNSTMEIVFYIYPSSLSIANLTSNQEKKGYSFDIIIYLSNYKKYFDQSKLIVEMKLNKRIIALNENKLILYNDNSVLLSLNSIFRVINKEHSVYFELYKSAFSSFSINYEQVRQYIFILNSGITILLSVILITLITISLIIRYRKIRESLSNA